MNSNVSTKQLNFGSPSNGSRRSPPRSHSKRSSLEDKMEIGFLSVNQRLNFGSPAKEEEEGCMSPVPTGRLTFGSTHSAEKKADVSPVYPEKEDCVSPVPIGRLTFGSPDEESPHAQFMSAEETHPENSQKITTYMVNLDIHPPPVPETKKNEGGIELAVPVSMFLSSLRKHGVLSPLPSETTAFSSPSTPPVGSGSFATAFQSPTNPDYVVKISELGTNGKTRHGDTPKVDNKELLRFLIASNKCLGNPNCAKVSGITMCQTPDGSWRMCVEQEKCSPLTREDATRVLECFIALLQKFLPSRVYPKDFKVSNFGKNASGQVVWFDFDFGTVNKKKPVPSIVSSGDFQFDGNEQFQRWLLALIELFCPPITSFFREPLIKDRKDVFRVLNQQKGLLQRYGLLSSEKSVSETTIDDFIEVLRRLCLSEEDISYLVGLIVPPASSQ